MKTLKLIGMVPLVLVAAATSFGQGDDRAVPRTGGSSSSSDAGSRHSGGSSSASSSSGGSSSDRGGSTWSSGDQSSRSSDAAARRPRPGTGTGTRDRYGNDRDHYRSYPYSSYYYDPYYYDDGYYDDSTVAVVPGDGDAVAYCRQRFKSYDIRTQTYLGYDGQRHPCP